MSDKHVFFAFVGGIASAIIAGLLGAAAETLLHVDSGDDGWGLMFLFFIILAGIAGFFFSTRWIRAHVKEEL